MLSYLTLAVQGAGELLDQNQQAAAEIATNWEQLWASVITPDSALYAALARVGVIFAVGSLMLWGTKIVQDFVENNSSAFLHELIWPIIVIFFLAGNGYQLAQASLLVRQLINEVNQDVLIYTSASLSLQEAYEQAKNHGAARSQIGTLLEQCQALIGEQQIDCLENAKIQSEEIIATYGLEGNWASNLLNRIQAAISAAEGGNVIFAPFSALIGAANQDLIRSLLIAMQIGFQQLLEVSLLLTALLGPMAVGGSLLPVGNKAIFAWITGMFSVGVAKLCFNIIVGLAATVIANAEAGDGLWFLIYIGFMAPFLATSLAAGGGMAVWSSLTNVAGDTAELAANLVGRVSIPVGK